jgi:hypothetical protein
MDQAFGAVREANMNVPDVPMGVPGAGSRPNWVLPVIVAAVALVLGGGVAIAVMFLR